MDWQFTVMTRNVLFFFGLKGFAGFCVLSGEDVYIGRPKQLVLKCELVVLSSSALIGWNWFEVRSPNPQIEVWNAWTE